MKILPLNILLSKVEGKPDDLLILANSFEKRCQAFVNKLSQQEHPPYKANSVALFIYSDMGDRFVRQRCTANLKVMEYFAARLSLTGRIDKFYFEPYEIHSTIQEFMNLFASLPNNSSIVVDISTIPKIHLFYLIDEAFNSNRIKTLRLVYSRARYGKYDALSWGAEEPIILPKIGKPRSSANMKSCLLIFCGLEPERSYSVWRRFGQDRCIQVFIDPGVEDFERPTERAYRYNNFDVRAERITLPAFRPDEIVKQIKVFYANCQSNNEHLFIAPLTTKWEVCAIWSFFKNYRKEINASIVYSAPGRFNAAGYTVDEFGDVLYSQIDFDKDQHAT